MAKRIKIDKEHRIRWLNFASSYIHAAEAIAERLEIPTESVREDRRNELMIIPMLYLLRQAIELAIKSFFISHNQEFATEHDLSNLLNEASKYVELKSDRQKSSWKEIENIVDRFSKTKYGGERLFKKDDINSDLLRYPQVDELSSYAELKKIDYPELIKKVRKVRSLCEALTIKLIVQWYE